LLDNFAEQYSIVLGFEHTNKSHQFTAVGLNRRVILAYKREHSDALLCLPKFEATSDAKTGANLSVLGSTHNTAQFVRSDVL